MRSRVLDIPDVFVFEPEVRADRRGSFLEWFRQDEVLAVTGRRLRLEQANMSVSVRGVLRGVHVAQVPPGQAKYATAVSGRIVDIVVDLRVGSPTFGRSDAVVLDDHNHCAVFIPEGVGHAFVAISDSAALCYLVDERYNTDREFTISAEDPELALPLPIDVGPFVLSDRDRAAPTLASVKSSGLLPTWDACRAVYESER